MIRGQEMELAMGLPIMIEGFNDGKVRMCYPFKLNNITVANGLLSSFDHEDLYKNFKDEQATQNMATLFALAFKVTDDKDLNELLHAIDKDNFTEIISDVKKVSGIEDGKESKSSSVSSGSQQVITWETGVNIIPIYTSVTYEQIPELTLTQYHKLIELISKKINYEYKTSALGLVKEPSKFITESDNPLYSEPKFEDKKHVTMNDIQGLFTMKK